MGVEQSASRLAAAQNNKKKTESNNNLYFKTQTCSKTIYSQEISIRSIVSYEYVSQIEQNLSRKALRGSVRSAARCSHTTTTTDQ